LDELVAERAGRHAAEARPQTEDVVERGRIAQRAHHVAAVGHRLQAQGQADRRAAARSAGRPRRVPRVARDAEDGVVGVRAESELGRVGLADDDGTGAPHARHHQPVVRRHMIGQRRAERGADAGRRGHVLDGQRKAVQRPATLAARQFRIAGIGLRQQAFARLQADDGVHRRVQRLDALEVGEHRLVAREAARAQGRAELAGTELGDRVVRSLRWHAPL
jgi:hypothetical protein